MPTDDRLKMQHSPLLEPAHHVGEPRYPIYDPSYPVWSRPKWSKNKKKYNKGYGKINIGIDTNESMELLHAIEPRSAKQTDEEEPDPNKMDDGEKKRYMEEIRAGDMTRLLGINQHKYQPAVYYSFDLGRRFVPQYPYKEINHNDINGDEEDPSLIPKRAPPELVLAVANEAEKKQAAQTVDPNEHTIKQESLRSGDYWNAFWKEDVEDPENALRSPKNSKLDTISAKLSPGSPIYDYVSRLNKSHPKLLYVVNKSKLN